MNWINGFEIMCYGLTAVFLADIIRRKSWGEFWLFLSAAFAGFALELLTVRVTDIYHYIHYYNTHHVQRKLGVLTPMEKHVRYLAA